MENMEFDVTGAPVVFSNKPSPPKNPLNRPNISYKNFFLTLLGLGIVITAAICISKFYLGRLICEHIPLNEKQFAILFTLVVSILYISAFLKRALIWLIHFYQHYAPNRIRLKCVFEPSCSEYMILSIKKYGTIKGTLNGIVRLFRCHPPNGGKDYP